MADQGFRMPSGSGGLVRYSDEYKSKVQLKPIHVVIIITIVVVAEIILKFAASATAV
ncbi:MAG TPA: preprotein translocase subunit Sec61beta [Patescibacteria group bacterium]|nr:preprotein translocase subunit Sec61beta [Patescibacteria group bacterium]